MRKNLFNIFLTVLAIAAIAFVSAPWFAFRALKAATEYEDVAAIGELVDFGATRAALTQQLKDPNGPVPVTAEPPSIWRDPLGVIRRAIRPLAPPEPKIDKFLTTQGLSALTRGYAPGAAPPVTTGPRPLTERIKNTVRGPYPRIAYWDPNRTRIAIPRPGDTAKLTVFTWQRRGWFEWKLVGITLPPGED